MIHVLVPHGPVMLSASFFGAHANAICGGGVTASGTRRQRLRHRFRAGAVDGTGEECRAENGPNATASFRPSHRLRAQSGGSSVF
jgi:hypothetical protein